MNTNVNTNFSTINTNIVIQAQLLIPAYQEFTEMRWEAYLLEKLQTLPLLKSEDWLIYLVYQHFLDLLS